MEHIHVVWTPPWSRWKIASFTKVRVDGEGASAPKSRLLVSNSNEPKTRSNGLKLNFILWLVCPKNWSFYDVKNIFQFEYGYSPIIEWLWPYISPQFWDTHLLYTKWYLVRANMCFLHRDEVYVCCFSCISQRSSMTMYIEMVIWFCNPGTIYIWMSGCHGKKWRFELEIFCWRSHFWWLEASNLPKKTPRYKGCVCWVTLPRSCLKFSFFPSCSPAGFQNNFRKSENMKNEGKPIFLRGYCPKN